jgi:ATP-dependent exoDNAse (exonuclease V) alpha subunit
LLLIRECFIKLQADNAQHIRIYARYTTDSLQTTVDEATATLLSLQTAPEYDDPKLDLAIGSRVRVTRNIATQLGLFKGALGTVHSMAFKGKIPDDKMPTNPGVSICREIPIVFVKLDHYKGVSVSDDIPNLVCFSELPSITKLKKIYTRHQLPLQLAHASTVHKFQGQTAKHPLILYPPDIGEYTSRGLEYVMISRPTTATDIFLMNPLRMDHFNSHKYAVQRNLITKEYTRLRELFN